MALLDHADWRAAAHASLDAGNQYLGWIVGTLVPRLGIRPATGHDGMPR